MLVRTRIRLVHALRARGAPLAKLDRALLRALRHRGHQPALEAAMKGLGWSGEWGAIWSGSSVVAAVADPRRRSRWLVAAAVPPASIVANYAFKRLIRRERPVIEELPALGYAASSLSFPSAHATSSVAAATAMARVAPGARPLLYGLAVLICAGRPYLGMHYPSDVLVGVVLGRAIGRLMPGLDAPVAVESEADRWDQTPFNVGSDPSSAVAGRSGPGGQTPFNVGSDPSSAVAERSGGSSVGSGPAS